VKVGLLKVAKHSLNERIRLFNITCILTPVGSHLENHLENLVEHLLLVCDYPLQETPIKLLAD